MTPWRGIVATGVLAGLVGLAACVGDSSTGPATDTTPTGPSITTQPVSLILTRGTAGSMGVTAAGTAPLTYQWYHNSVAIASAITDSLKITGASDADSGSYFVVIGNSVAVDTSKIVVVLIRPPVSTTAWRQEGGAAVSNERQFASTVIDESAVYVFNNGLLTMLATVVDKSASASNFATSRTRGVNSAVLAASGSRIYATGGVIESSGDGSAAVFATGAGSRLTVTSALVSTAGATSPTIGASDGATVVITGGSLMPTKSDAVVVSASSASDAPVAVTLAAGVTVTAGTGTLFRVENGGIATLTLDSVTVTGNAAVDASSTATVVAQHFSMWAGVMQGGAVTLDATSTWTVAGNSAITVLANPSITGSSITNVFGNGWTVTYDATLAANAALGGKTYTLVGGGQLTPR